ncbi:hypothetical protein [Escherichia coli]|uniref:hypothetical protein n=1 Tax=Escherichia coli TaxID=562 RepID=UPI0020345FA3|nr:hypothetical protein [Escherichia coli]
MKPRSGMTLLSRTLAAGFSAPEKRVLLVVPEDADIRPLNGCDVISAKNIAYPRHSCTGCGSLLMMLRNASLFPQLPQSS